MSGPRYEEENSENSSELSMGSLLEEEFKDVFGGATPVTTAWAGLTFA